MIKLWLRKLFYWIKGLRMNFRIYGDNILECERALELISKSLDLQINHVESPLYAPEYSLLNNNNLVGRVKLFPGYDQCGINIQNIFEDHGAPLRETSDAVITSVTGTEEEVLFSIEFCNALPAGNNAWQRTGRAIACAAINVPYLHIAEIGGVELDEDRNSKSHRFPNPIVPFAYITLSKNYNSLTIPVYLPSPSSPKEIREEFREAFGLNEGMTLIKNLILKEDHKKTVNSLVQRSINLVSLLANHRKREDTLKDSDWEKLLGTRNSLEQLNWLERKNIPWSKKGAGKVLTTKSFKDLLELVKNNSLSIGAGNIPICMIPSKNRKNLSLELKKLYGEKITPSLLKWIESNNTPLVIVWITGFKPKGDDSRPDRGLVPLARMLAGPDSDILSIVYGPAKKKMLDMLEKSPAELAKHNGLWESILNLSDAVLTDSITCTNSPISLVISRNKKTFRDKISFSSSSKKVTFGEQDVDSVIHLLFAHSTSKNIFESMCNPPGGDWSGLSFFDFSNTQYRWTSLPRVSKSKAKRPDHVLQIKINNESFIMLSIESKDKASKLNDTIGVALNRFTNDLIKTAPNVRKVNGANWEFTKITWKIKEKIYYYSGGAFCYKNDFELEKAIKKGKLDIVLALEFKEDSGIVKIHIKTASASNPLINFIKDIAKNFGKKLEIQIH